MLESGIHALPFNETAQKDLPKAPSPVALLSRLNRSRVLPQLVPPNPPKVSTLQDGLTLARSQHLAGETHSHLLDRLAATGLSWDLSAKLLTQIAGIVFDADEVDAVAEARLFWTLFAEARARYRWFVDCKNGRRWTGDWGYFHAEELDCLLPGLILADHFRRREFLAQYTHSAHPYLELYNIKGKPLCRHLFESISRVGLLIGIG